MKYLVLTEFSSSDDLPVCCFTTLMTMCLSQSNGIRTDTEESDEKQHTNTQALRINTVLWKKLNLSPHRSRVVEQLYKKGYFDCFCVLCLFSPTLIWHADTNAAFVFLFLSIIIWNRVKQMEAILDTSSLVGLFHPAGFGMTEVPQNSRKRPFKRT